ncbi:hypothetical protein HD554DRAFT_1993983, partial [Boletus coccyginus]
WLKLLVTIEDYKELDLVLPTIGVQLQYKPETTVALSGQFIQHEVGEVMKDRGVVAFYMRNNIHE